jgi:hypothetical protein
MATHVENNGPQATAIEILASYQVTIPETILSFFRRLD